MEQPLYWYGSCNLGPINISNHVVNPFSDSAYFDWEEYIQSIKLMVILLDKMLDISYYPLKEQHNEVILKRLIGVGFTGLADALAKLKIKYNSQKAIDFSESIMQMMSEVGYKTSSELAKYFGSFEIYDEKILDSYNVKMLSEETQNYIKENGLRNSRITSIAPTGTTSLVMNNCSSGIEPIFALSYDRRVLQNDGTKKVEEVENDAWNLYKNSEYYDGTVPDYFVLTDELTPLDHINLQAAVQKWCCTSISKTINLPVDISYDDFKNVYWDAFDKGLKGCTTYRPNSILGSVIEVKKEEKEEKKDAKKELKEYFNIWKEQEKGDVVHDNVSLPSEYPMKGWKMTSEGRKWYINVAFKDKKCERPFAIFVNTNAREDSVNTYDAIDKLNSLANKKGISNILIQKNRDKCASQNNINKICRTIGLLLRHNVKIIDIIKTLDSLDVPVGSFIFRIKKFMMMFIEEIPANGTPCPECGAPVSYRDGCQSCTECFWSKCA